MRFTRVLNAQHLGWYFKKHWQIQGKRIPIDTGAKTVLETFNKNTIVEATDIANQKSPSRERKEFIFNNDDEVSTSENISVNSCYVYQDEHVLIEGLPQARILTNTIEINSIPKRLNGIIDKTTIQSTIDKNIQELVLSSFVFDSEQEKLAKIKIPEKPTFNLPRKYGITDERKSRQTTLKLLMICEKLLGKISSKRKIVNNINVVTSIDRDNCKIQLNIPINVLITSKQPIEPFKEKFDAELPDIFPLKCTVSIPQREELVIPNFYPLRKEIEFSNPHTVITYYSPLKVKNLNEIPVTTAQYQGRTFLAAFTTAAAKARQLYGFTKTIPKPIVVQSIQTDGKTFHFGIYQLNTLDLDNNDGIKNYWFDIPIMNLFEDCSYVNGRPVLENFDNTVFKYIKAFYENN